MTLNIAGKCAVVTGSTTGMGRAIIERLARAGCNVMLHGLAEEDVMQVPALMPAPCPISYVYLLSLLPRKSSSQSRP